MILELTTAARTICRKMGIIPALHRVRMLWHTSDYEDKFSAALLGAVRADDCVWDVGANVGYYTEQLSRRARLVVAFEPVLDNITKINARSLSNVKCRQMALGDKEAELMISRNGPYSSLVSSPASDETTYETTHVMPGDALVDLAPPDIVKIDVEGYEPEVIRGMRRVLSSARAVFIEVHFSLLANRGLAQQPAAIVRDLKQLGFTSVKWVDASHIEARK
jgi:FkbM family methyltransferase